MCGSVREPGTLMIEAGEGDRKSKAPGMRNGCRQSRDPVLRFVYHPTHRLGSRILVAVAGEQCEWSSATDTGGLRYRLDYPDIPFVPHHTVDTPKPTGCH